VSEAPPRVSVIVPHYSDLGRLDICLAALCRQTYPRDAFEIVVSDNNSPEGEAAVARVIDGRARLTIVPVKGAGAARNGGVDAARGEILAFTDSDCQPAAEWLARGLEALEGFDFVGGRMTVLARDPDHLTACEAFERVFAFDNEDYVLRKRFTVTANLFARRSVFEAVGGFETRVVSEDVDWCLRAGAAGFRIGYASAAVVGHPARRDWPDLIKKWRRMNSETFGLFARGRAGRLRWLLRALLMPFSAVVHTPRALAGRGLGSLGQRLGAVLVLYRLRFWRCGDSLRLLLAGPDPR
jgi:GT2 family glycosyltransferase